MIEISEIFRYKVKIYYSKELNYHFSIYHLVNVYKIFSLQCIQLTFDLDTFDVSKELRGNRISYQNIFEHPYVFKWNIISRI